MRFNNTEASNAILDKLTKYFSTDFSEATEDQVYKAVAMTVRDILLRKKNDYNARVRATAGKRVYYICMEYLLGRSLKNNLYNLGIEQTIREVLKKHEFNLDGIYELEADAGLGNGGLGRLAACYLDALATESYPALGFTIKYEFGLFKQRIVDNQQVELPDEWLNMGEFWLVPRSDKTFRIKFGGRVVEDWSTGKLVIRYADAEIIEAVPYDMMISGANSEAVCVLRLWDAKSGADFNMHSFASGDYMNAMRRDTEAELITKVLYPSDGHYAGKSLRIMQQYFLVSASVQNIIKDHLKYNPSLDNLHEKVAIHINDTHPALAVPELMRILVDEYDYTWEQAWHITVSSLAYTNHTVMAEALEKWSEDLISTHVPRLYAIIKEINRRFLAAADAAFHDGARSERMSIISNGLVRMANLSVIGSHCVNGVSALHSEIIRKSIFKDFYEMTPDKFTNVTNGIAHRRWLCQANPRLASLIDTLIGDGYKQNAAELEGLKKYTGNKAVLERFAEIKLENKKSFAEYAAGAGVKLDPYSRFDVHIKRLHEYKRQLLNTLKIISLYLDLKDDRNADITPQTFIFGAKAAPSYYHAKRIINLINCLAEEIRKDGAVNKKLSVYFVENYKVSIAEKLIPAAEVSEQISTAGKEASGTSNMKFMLNGAVTLGTMDGANVEIYESVGKNNIFIFGLDAAQVEKVYADGYYASYYYSRNEKIKHAVDFLKTEFRAGEFADIANYLTTASGLADPYLCLADFEDYLRAHNEMDAAYRNKTRWNNMAIANISEAGRFAADRSIGEYAKNIWKLEKIR
ncbi:MAG: glycogen/starch/alpha-glucan phosphorylase [Clostridiales bacterium]|jgi:starch phosphorylase|nr:glycogen/starch/alpha-glucan phosphorylase [Clostridiales bacterium]